MGAVPSGHAAALALPHPGRLLAVDPGDVRVGLAISDPDQTVASPLETQPAGDTPEAIADGIAEVAGEQAVVGVVVGYPRTLAGREGPAARRAREIAEAIGDRLDLPVVLWDERFTTTEAERVMLEQNVRRRKRRQAIDRVAASLILQGVLEARRGGAAWR